MYSNDDNDQKEDGSTLVDDDNAAAALPTRQQHTGTTTRRQTRLSQGTKAHPVTHPASEKAMPKVMTTKKMHPVVSRKNNNTNLSNDDATTMLPPSAPMHASQDNVAPIPILPPSSVPRQQGGVPTTLSTPSATQTRTTTPPSSNDHNVSSGTTTSTTMPGMSPWMRTYLSTRPGLLVIPRDFMEDNFNLVHLPHILESWVQQQHKSPLQTTRNTSILTSSSFSGGWLYQQALQRILAYPERNEETNSTSNNTTATNNDSINDLVDWAATILYQLIHQRYAVSPRGLEAIRRRFLVWKYQSLKISDPTTTTTQASLLPPPYGRCPRISCAGFALLPLGPDSPLEETDDVNRDVRPWRYCASCQETWRIDVGAATGGGVSYPITSSFAEEEEGCAWGTTVGPLFHLIYPHFLDGTQFSSNTGSTIMACNEPRIFGFRLWKG
jgi:hypothetical protein